MGKILTTEIKLGDMVLDQISGFAGTVTARSEGLHGSVEWLVESERTSQAPSQRQIYQGPEIRRLKVIGNCLEGVLPKRRTR